MIAGTVESFDGAFYAAVGGSYYGPFATEEAARAWFKGGGPLATRMLDPMGRPWAPTPPPKPRTVPSVPRKPPAPTDPRFRKPPESRFGYGFTELEERQWGWERRHALLRAHRTGATYRELAEFTKLSTLFVHTLIDAAERDERQGHEAPFSHQFRDRNLFWDEREARLFVRSLDRSLTLARRKGRDWLYLATLGFSPTTTE